MAKKQKEIPEEERYTPTFDSLFIEALRQKNVENWLMGINMLYKCMSINPESAAVYWELGIMHQFNGNEKFSEYYLKKAAQLAPTNYYYQVAIADWYNSHNRYNEAIEQYEMIVREFPEKDEVLYDLSVLYYNTNQYNKAIAVLNKMERRFGVSQNLSMEKARIYLTMNRRRNALAEVDVLIRKNPKNSMLWVYKGDIENLFHREENALAFYQKSLEIAPENGPALVALCDYMSRKGRIEEAENYMQRIFKAKDIDFDNKVVFLQQAIQYYAGHHDEEEQITHILQSIVDTENEMPWAHMYYADMLKHYGHMQEAMEEFRTATYLDPNCTDCWQELFMAAYKQRDTVQVMKTLNDAMEAVPDSPEFYYFSGHILYEAGNDSLAYTLLKKSEKLTPADAHNDMARITYTILSEIDYRHGRKLEAMNYLQKALAIDPKNASLLNDYAYYLAVDDLDLDRAERMSAQAVESDPLNAAFLDTYAYILMKKSQFQNAFFYIQRAIEYDKDEPNNPEIIEHCGDILYFLGSPEDAVQMWQQALDSGQDTPILRKKILNKRYEK